jgi:hypothetical protein
MAAAAYLVLSSLLLLLQCKWGCTAATQQHETQEWRQIEQAHYTAQQQQPLQGT